MDEWAEWAADRAFDETLWKPENKPETQIQERISEDMDYDDYLVSTKEARARYRANSDESGQTKGRYADPVTFSYGYYQNLVAAAEDKLLLQEENKALQAEVANLRYLIHGSLKRGAAAEALKAVGYLLSIDGVERFTAELENRGWSFA